MARLRLVPLALLALLAAPGCTSWQAVRADTPAAMVETRRPGVVRVTCTDGSVLVIHQPIVRNDSLVGVAEDGVSYRGVAERDVVRAETRQMAAGRTLGMGLGVGLGAIVLLSLIILIELMSDWN